jgi:hypothetical protein
VLDSVGEDDEGLLFTKVEDEECLLDTEDE